MSARTITGILLATLVVGCIGYDVWAYFEHDEATISEWIWNESKNFPLIPFGMGILMGHLFWQVKK